MNWALLIFDVIEALLPVVAQHLPAAKAAVIAPTQAPLQ